MIYVALLLGLLIAAGILLVALNDTPKRAEPRTVETSAPEAEPTEQLPYLRRPHICTDPEMHFFHVLDALCHAAQPPRRVLAQVPLTAILDLPPDTANRQSWRGRIDRRTVDYAIIDSSTRVLAAIELDDATHNRPSRKERDQFVGAAFETAGVQLVRFSHAEAKDRDLVAARLGPALTAPKPAPPPSA